MVHAVQEILKNIRSAQSGNHPSRMIILLAALDVENAFKSARWTDMIEALKRFKTSQHLLRMIRSYLKDRRLTYATTDVMRTKEITAGAAKGSISGPDIWNIAKEVLETEGLRKNKGANVGVCVWDRREKKLCDRKEKLYGGYTLE